MLNSVYLKLLALAANACLLGMKISLLPLHVLGFLHRRKWAKDDVLERIAAHFNRAAEFCYMRSIGIRVARIRRMPGEQAKELFGALCNLIVSGVGVMVNPDILAAAGLRAVYCDDEDLSVWYERSFCGAYKLEALPQKYRDSLLLTLDNRQSRIASVA